MKDHHSRRIDYLRLSVTDRCNLRCQYCMPPEGVVPKRPEEILSYEELTTIGRVAAKCGITKIRLTGGEPTVRKDLTRLVGNLAGLEGINDIALTTNGLLLRQMARQLKDVGLTRVNVSIDTLSPEKYLWLTRRGDVEKVLDGIDAALEEELAPVKVNVVALHPLKDGFAEIARLSVDRPIHVRFIEHMPVGKGSFGQPESYISTAEIKEELLPLGALEDAGGPTGWGPARYHRLPGALGTIGFISPQSGHFCQSCNRLRVTADGQLRACLFATEQIDLRPTLRGGGGEQALVEVFRQALLTKPRARPVAASDGQMSQIGG